MRMIEIAALDNGAHNNQTYHGVLPDGWAIIRDGAELANYPFGTFEVEEIDGKPYMKVDTWTPLPMPEPEPVEVEPNADDVLNALLGVSV
jgi:hypothetical protein